jgi:hypothetical protein
MGQGGWVMNDPINIGNRCDVARTERDQRSRDERLVTAIAVDFELS